MRMFFFFLLFHWASFPSRDWLQGLPNPSTIPRQKVFNQQLVVIDKEKKQQIKMMKRPCWIKNCTNFLFAFYNHIIIFLTNRDPFRVCHASTTFCQLLCKPIPISIYIFYSSTPSLFLHTFYPFSGMKLQNVPLQQFFLCLSAAGSLGISLLLSV